MSSKKCITPVVKIIIQESCEFCCPNVKHIGDDTYCSVTGTNFGEGASYPFKMYPYQKECPYLKAARNKAIRDFVVSLGEGIYESV